MNTVSIVITTIRWFCACVACPIVNIAIDIILWSRFRRCDGVHLNDIRDGAAMRIGASSRCISSTSLGRSLTGPPGHHGTYLFFTFSFLMRPAPSLPFSTPASAAALTDACRTSSQYPLTPARRSSVHKNWDRILSRTSKLAVLRGKLVWNCASRLRPTSWRPWLPSSRHQSGVTIQIQTMQLRSLEEMAALGGMRVELGEGGCRSRMVRVRREPAFSTVDERTAAVCIAAPEDEGGKDRL